MVGNSGNPRRKKNPRLSITLSRTEEAELSAMAGKYQVHRSWLGRRAIQDFLDKYRHEEMQLPLNLPRGGNQ
jgi:hypothetical protein